LWLGFEVLPERKIYHKKYRGEVEKNTDEVSFFVYVRIESGKAV
jgi:hypothetical protein